jgi:hypothetical protein
MNNMDLIYEWVRKEFPDMNPMCCFSDKMHMCNTLCFEGQELRHFPMVEIGHYSNVVAFAMDVTLDGVTSDTVVCAGEFFRKDVFGEYVDIEEPIDVDLKDPDAFNKMKVYVEKVFKV